MAGNILHAIIKNDCCYRSQSTADGSGAWQAASVALYRRLGLLVSCFGGLWPKLLPVCLSLLHKQAFFHSTVHIFCSFFSHIGSLVTAPVIDSTFRYPGRSVQVEGRSKVKGAVNLWANPPPLRTGESSLCSSVSSHRKSHTSRGASPSRCRTPSKSRMPLITLPCFPSSV